MDYRLIADFYARRVPRGLRNGDHVTALQCNLMTGIPIHRINQLCESGHYFGALYLGYEGGWVIPYLSAFPSAESSREYYRGSLGFLARKGKVRRGR